MAYATVADAIAHWGEAAITLVCDRDGDGVLDEPEFERQLTIASQQMDGYLIGRYPLPHPNPPEIAKKLCVDIAVYNSTPGADTRTDEMRRRYEDAMKYMQMVAENKIKWPAVEDPQTNVANASQLAATDRPTTRAGSWSSVCTPAYTTANTRRIL